MWRRWRAMLDDLATSIPGGRPVVYGLLAIFVILFSRLLLFLAVLYGVIWILDRSLRIFYGLRKLRTGPVRPRPEPRLRWTCADIQGRLVADEGARRAISADDIEGVLQCAEARGHVTRFAGIEKLIETLQT